jgi:hypothetical protein
MTKTVYVLSDAAMPGILKIGVASKPPSALQQELYAEGVPVPYQCEYACMVKDAVAAMRAIRAGLAEPKAGMREGFFVATPEGATQALAPYEVKDVTEGFSCAFDAALTDDEKKVRDAACRKLKGSSLTRKAES